MSWTSRNYGAMNMDYAGALRGCTETGAASESMDRLDDGHIDRAERPRSAGRRHSRRLRWIVGLDMRHETEVLRAWRMLLRKSSCAKHGIGCEGCALA